MIAHQIGPIASCLVPNIASIVTPVALTITNPGAESGGGTPGWTASIITSGTAQTNGSPRTGSRIFYNAASGAYGTMTQTLSVPSSAYFGVDNNAYNLVFNRWANCQLTGSGGTYMRFDFLDGSSQLIERVDTAYKTVTQNTWTLLTETVLCPPGTRSIKVTLYIRNASGSSSSQKGYIDDMDASLVRVADTAKIDYSTLAAIMGSRLDALAVRQADTYAIFGAPLDRLAVRDARVYFIITP